MAQTYRWNIADHAAGFDATAQHIHPYYLEIQDAIVGQIDREADARFFVIDLGGGSGRLVERILDRFARSRAMVIDQSQAFLELARGRLQRFDERAQTHLARLQDDWPAALGESPQLIVSTSAIHHLDAGEKQTLYRKCHDVLAPGGVLLNGDEVRAADDDEYLGQMKAWVEHKNQAIAAGLIPEPLIDVLSQWEERNVGRFGQPRTSGDDCHQTVAEQLEYLRQAGFRQASAVWQKAMWAVMRGDK